MLPPETLRPHRSLAAFGAITFLFFGGMALLSTVSQRPATLATTALIAAFALAGAWMAVAALVEHHVVTEVGLRFHPLIGRPREVNWHEVTDVRYSPGMQWFRVRGAGAEVRVSRIFQGLATFATMVLDKVDHSAI